MSAIFFKEIFGLNIRRRRNESYYLLSCNFPFFFSAGLAIVLIIK
jgi:hypothetical protein